MATPQDVLTLTRVQKDTGATIKPGPMVSVPPEQAVTDAMLADVAAGSGLNGAMLADLVAAMATHENMGVNMYRALRTAVTNPMLTSAFEQFEADSLQAVAEYKTLMSALGIPGYYISPAARMTEGLDSHMIMSLLAAGSADPLTIDLKAVEMVMLAATMCVANTELLRKTGEQADAGAAKDAIAAAVAALAGPQSTHLTWATETQQRMAMSLVSHPVGHKLAQFAETAIAKLQGKAT